MCAICKGWTHEEVAADQRHHIATIGWSVQMVEPRPGRVGWSYTIGLSESYGHPELLLVGRDVRADHEVLNRLGAAVRDGTTVRAGSSVVADLPLEAWEVHPVHLFGELVTSWRTVYEDRSPDERPELRFLQVREVPADETDRDLRTRLDRPYARLPRP
ncbi:DUF4262 domain-containing protein [Microlunatus antarcticus]|uniref:DUF4262 domain-containing protein n=1 Tax=Microlunatus antarcticus TaxID=53388 RepID=A0A7W5P978_9ACTN|nr:DUF4262 domain-containing protein [Microlunatus antarcticus]MBB3328626.1 hypothetical protein [Microlunatus antarcticus]